VARILVDLADVLPERKLADAVHEAEVRRLFDLSALEQALSRVAGRSGRHRLGRVLTAYRGERPLTRSGAERRLLELCASRGLPAPRTAASIGGYEVDFLWPAAGLCVEVDGAAAHHTSRAFHADRRRDRELAALGIHVVRVTWRDLEGDLALLADQLEAILALKASKRG
jgi:very-short-patch-repair endonuclease